MERGGFFTLTMQKKHTAAARRASQQMAAAAMSSRHTAGLDGGSPKFEDFFADPFEDEDVSFEEGVSYALASASRGNSRAGSKAPTPARLRRAQGLPGDDSSPFGKSPNNGGTPTPSRHRRGSKTFDPKDWTDIFE